MTMSSIKLWSPCSNRLLCSVLLVVLICCFSLEGYSQLDDIPLSGNNNKENSVKRVFHGEPGRAALYSLILPGAGQYYNKSYWKIPLVWAGEGYAIYNLTQQIQGFNTFNDCRIDLINNGSSPVPSSCVGIGINGVDITMTNVAFDEAQEFRESRETAWLILGAVHLLNAVDAFVHRHLINFDTEDDISFQVRKQSSWQSTQYTLARVRIPLNK